MADGLARSATRKRAAENNRGETKMWPGSSPLAVVNGAAGMIISALLVGGARRSLSRSRRLVLAPLVRRLEGWGLPNAFAVPAVIVVLLAALFGGATVAGREVTQLLEEVPQHEANLREKARFLHFELGRRGVGEGAAATPRSVEQEITDPKENSGPVPLSTIERCRTAALPSSTMPARFAILLIGGQTMLPIEHRARLPRVGV
jgi:hypothetical protein